MLPFKDPNINSGINVDDVNNFSIWNSQMKICLLENVKQLEKAIHANDRRRIIYFLGILNCFKYHPRINSGAINLIDILLLQKTWQPHRKRFVKYSQESQTCQSQGQLRRQQQCISLGRLGQLGLRGREKKEEEKEETQHEERTKKIKTRKSKSSRIRRRRTRKGTN